MKHSGFVLGALLLVAGHGAPAWAVNKCVGADGRVTYTDSPCAPDSRVTRVDTPPLPTPGEQAEARARGEELVRDAQALEARQAADALARRREHDARLAAEQAAQQRQAQQDAARDEAERRGAMYPLPLVVSPAPRYLPPRVPVAPPKPKAAEQERPAPMRSFPFR